MEVGEDAYPIRASSANFFVATSRRYLLAVTRILM